MNLRALFVVSLCSCGLEPEMLDDDELAAEVPRGLAAPAPFKLGNWNIEWLGSTRAGPTDEALQQANAAGVLAQARADVWGLSEVVSAQALLDITATLPGYRSLLASEVAGGTLYYSTQEQKVALLWREGSASVLEAGLILTEHAYDFAGRPPLRVKLRLSGGAELTVVVVHLKAMFDADAVARRQRSAQALEAWLQGLGEAPFAVIGDWNDRVSAFSTAHVFVTRALDAAGAHSTVTGSRMIDHQLVPRSLEARWKGTRLLEPAVEGYATTTSDHYPVVSEWSFAADVRIAEVLANEPGSDRSSEHVRLIGRGDLSGWTLSDATQVRHVFPAGTLLDGELLVRGADASEGTLSLNNPADAVVLRDREGSVVDTVSWTRRQADGVALTPSTSPPTGP